MSIQCVEYSFTLLSLLVVARHYTNLTKRVGLVQSRPRHHLIEKYPVLAMI
jgi:hypothetical protein